MSRSAEPQAPRFGRPRGRGECAGVFLSLVLFVSGGLLSAAETILISDKENTVFRYRPLGAADWLEIGVGKYVDFEMPDSGRFEISAKPPHCDEKVITLTRPKRELYFYFLKSDCMDVKRAKTEPKTLRILYLAADPFAASTKSPLRLGQEARDIQQRVREGSHRDRIEIKTAFALRTTDLTRLFDEYRPNVVHFSGHGGALGVYLESPGGGAKLVRAEALAALFEEFADTVECVILNACFSAAQGAAIRRHIPSVIGSRSTILDSRAISFSVGFYLRLANGKSVEESYRMGVIQMKIDDKNPGAIPEEQIPVLLNL